MVKKSVSICKRASVFVHDLVRYSKKDIKDTLHYAHLDGIADATENVISVASTVAGAVIGFNIPNHANIETGAIGAAVCGIASLLPATIIGEGIERGLKKLKKISEKWRTDVKPVSQQPNFQQGHNL